MELFIHRNLMQKQPVSECIREKGIIVNTFLIGKNFLEVRLNFAVWGIHVDTISYYKYEECN